MIRKNANRFNMNNLQLLLAVASPVLLNDPAVVEKQVRRIISPL